MTASLSGEALSPTTGLGSVVGVRILKLCEVILKHYYGYARSIQTTNIMSIVSLFLITVGCTDFLKYYYNDTHGSARHLYLIRSNKPQKPFLQIFNQSKPFKIFLKIDGPYGCIVDAWRSVSFFFALTSGCWKYG